MSAPLHFPATSSPLYRLDDETDAMALTDQMSARLAQLQALLAMTYGDAGGWRRATGTITCGPAT